MLEISHVRKHFGKQEVLKDVTLKVNKGDVIVILGPSGSGKTTFLRSLTFLERADEGEWYSVTRNWIFTGPNRRKSAG